MAYNLTISVKKDDFDYIRENDISPSELFRHAVDFHKNKEITTEKEYAKQIETHKRIIAATQKENERLYEELKTLKTANNILTAKNG